MAPEELERQLAELAERLRAAQAVDWDEAFRDAQRERNSHTTMHYVNTHRNKVRQVTRKRQEMYLARVQELRREKTEHRAAIEELEESYAVLKDYVARRRAGVGEEERLRRELRRKREDLLRKKDELSVRMARLKAGHAHAPTTHALDAPQRPESAPRAESTELAKSTETTPTPSPSPPQPLDSTSLRLHLPNGVYKIDASLTIDTTKPLPALKRQLAALRDRLAAFHPRLDVLPVDVESPSHSNEAWRRNVVIMYLRVLLARYQRKTGVVGGAGESEREREKREKEWLAREMDDEAKERMARRWNEAFAERRGVFMTLDGVVRTAGTRGGEKTAGTLETAGALETTGATAGKQIEEYEPNGFMKDEHAPAQELLGAQEKNDTSAKQLRRRFDAIEREMSQVEEHNENGFLEDERATGEETKKTHGGLAVSEDPNTSNLPAQASPTSEDEQQRKKRIEAALRRNEFYDDIHERIVHAGRKFPLDTLPSFEPEVIARLDAHLRDWLAQVATLKGMGPKLLAAKLLRQVRGGKIRSGMRIVPPQIWAGRFGILRAGVALEMSEGRAEKPLERDADAAVSGVDDNHTAKIPVAGPRAPLQSSSTPAEASTSAMPSSDQIRATQRPSTLEPFSGKSHEHNLNAVELGWGSEDGRRAAQGLPEQYEPEDVEQSELEYVEQGKQITPKKINLTFPTHPGASLQSDKPFTARQVARRAYSTSSRPPLDPLNHALAAKSQDSPQEKTSPTSPSQPPPSLPHLTPTGSAHMVSIAHKPHTPRTAIAVGTVYFSNATPLALITTNALKKGDVLSVSRIAGIMAAKKCPDIVPLCHPIPLTHVGVELRTFPASAASSRAGTVSDDGDDMGHGGVQIEAEVACAGATGVEMEALTAVMGTALSVVDMCKAVDKFQRIGGVRVVLKEGGKSGVWSEDGWCSWQRGAA